MGSNSMPVRIAHGGVGWIAQRSLVMCGDPPSSVPKQKRRGYFKFETIICFLFIYMI